jgi:hypothetical protein
VADALRQPMRARAAEVARVVRRGRRRAHTVVAAVEADRRHRDRRLRRQAPLDARIRRITGDEPEAVAVRMDHHVDEVGVVERLRAALEGGVVEAPARRPGLPQQPAQRAPIAGQPGTAAFAVKVVLVPEPAFGLRR